MFPMLALLFFQSCCIFYTVGNETCDPNERFKSYFDVAVDFINKAKSHYPEDPVTYPKELCRPIDCEEVLRSGRNSSGVYIIWPMNRLTDGQPLQVYCDMDTDDGGWTVIQRRGNFGRSEDYFYKDWASYKKGFGDIEEDFWLGNDNIFSLSNQRMYSIRFDLKDIKGETGHALYDTFWIDDENRKYTLHIQGYSGTAGDSMIERHNNQKFSTKDNENDIDKSRNCALTFKGAWWYSHCYHSNLNGLHRRGMYSEQLDKINWITFRSLNETLEATEMKIRPINFKRNLIEKIYSP